MNVLLYKRQNSRQIPIWLVLFGNWIFGKERGGEGCLVSSPWSTFLHYLSSNLYYKEQLTLCYPMSRRFPPPSWECERKGMQSHPQPTLWFYPKENSWCVKVGGRREFLFKHFFFPLFSFRFLYTDLDSFRPILQYCIHIQILPLQKFAILSVFATSVLSKVLKKKWAFWKAP